MRLYLVFIFILKIVYCIKAGKQYTYNNNRLEIIPKGRNNNLLQIERINNIKNDEKIAYLSYFKNKICRFYYDQTLKLYIRLFKYYLHFKIKRLYDLMNRFLNNFKKFNDPSLSENYPLVGNVWVLEYNNNTNDPNLPNKTQQLEFSDQGNVTTSTGLKGEWWIDYGKLVWKLPLCERKDRYMYFTAELYVGNTNKKPKMKKGIMFKDRIGSKWVPKNLFRPVVGTFEAYVL